MSDWKQKAIKVSLILMVCGMIIMLCGFGMAGFHTDRLNAKGEEHWYQTVHLGDGDFQFGIGR